MSVHSTKERVKIGAVIAVKNTIVSVGVNKSQSHTMQMRYNKFRQYREDSCLANSQHEIHAEIDAINRAINRTKHLDLSKAAIYVYREDKNGSLAMCRPCGACMRAIRDVGIRHIYYTSPDGYVHLETT
jgi:deoxycytidylate deaminase